MTKPAGGLPVGVAATSGPKFDRSVPNIAFLAGTMIDQGLANNPYTLVALNEIHTSKHLDILDRWCDERQMLFDSGVFAMAAKHFRKHNLRSIGEAFALPPQEMDGWNALYDKWCSIAQRFGDRMWGIIELDQGGADAARETRKQVLADTGVTPIPVYHPFSDGWDYYDELASSYDRICGGGLTAPVAGARIRLCYTMAERARAYPYLWTHLLGVTPMPWVMALGLKGSTDSSAWTAGLRWSSSWKAWAMLQRIGFMPVEMTYDRDSDTDGPSGHKNAKRQAGASATFMQHTLAAVTEDTHWTAR